MDDDRFGKILEHMLCIYPLHPEKAWDGAQEQYAFEITGELPEGHYVIASVETWPLGNLYIHADIND